MKFYSPSILREGRYNLGSVITAYVRDDFMPYLTPIIERSALRHFQTYGNPAPTEISDSDSCARHPNIGGFVDRLALVRAYDSELKHLPAAYISKYSEHAGVNIESLCGSVRLHPTATLVHEFSDVFKSLSGGPYTIHSAAKTIEAGPWRRKMHLIILEGNIAHVSGTATVSWNRHYRCANAVYETVALYATMQLSLAEENAAYCTGVVTVNGFFGSNLEDYAAWESIADQVLRDTPLSENVISLVMRYLTKWVETAPIHMFDLSADLFQKWLTLVSLIEHADTESVRYRRSLCLSLLMTLPELCIRVPALVQNDAQELALCVNLLLSYIPEAYTVFDVAKDATSFPSYFTS